MFKGGWVAPGFDLMEDMLGEGIEADAIFLGFDSLLQSLLQFSVLFGTEGTFKDGVLDAATIAFEKVGDFFASFVAGDVVRDDVEHGEELGGEG